MKVKKKGGEGGEKSCGGKERRQKVMAFVTADYKMLLSYRLHLGVYYNQKTDFSALGWASCSERQRLIALAQ